MSAVARGLAARAEYERRRAGERAKAERKYGADALLPAGRPDLDVLDYAVNELVGLVRYAEMLEARHQLMLDLMEGLPGPTRRAIRAGRTFGRELRGVAEQLALRAIETRQALKAQNLHLGETEAAL